MNIVLNRNFIGKKATDGVITIDNMRVADSAEHTPTMLPQGTYVVGIDHCPQYRRKMPLICIKKYADCLHCLKRHILSTHAMLPCFCPMIKIGNGAYNRTDGSIIIGDRYLNGVIINSAPYYDRLIDRLDKAQNRGEKITLTIKNSCVI